MVAILVFLNKTAQTYLQSIKKDLSIEGFESVLIIASISWTGLLPLGYLIATRQFSLPVDFSFYALWFLLIMSTILQSLFLIDGLVKSTFFTSNSVLQLSFVVTIVYAVICLREPVTIIGAAAFVMALLAVGLFIKGAGEPTTGRSISDKRGILSLVISVFFSPVTVIFYKAASNHAHSFAQFLSGRLITDFCGYTFLVVIIFIFFYRKTPIRAISSICTSRLGLGFMAGACLSNLLDSWLIFKLPVTEFTFLSMSSILPAYVIGLIKYKEYPNLLHVCGGLLILFATMLATH